VNYLSDILPVKRKITHPVCTTCFENQPLWEYFLLPRRCKECGTRRPVRVWVVEVLFIGVSIILWLNPSMRLGYSLSLILLIYFGVVVVIDLEHRLILHPVSWTGAVLCFGIGWSIHGVWLSILGGAAGYLIMLGFYYLGDVFGRLLARQRGETLTEVALGFGDVNLAGVLGLLLGWPGIIGGLLLAITIGGIVSLLYIVWMVINDRYSAFSAIPYGPFLVASAVLLLYFSDYLLLIIPR